MTIAYFFHPVVAPSNLPAEAPKAKAGGASSGNTMRNRSTKRGKRLKSSSGLRSFDVAHQPDERLEAA
jgi:hypothetical protein